MRNFIMCLIVIFMNACTGVQIPERPYKYFPLSKAAVKPPKWVEKGSGAYKDDENKRVFYGVGTSTGIRNYSFMRQVADDRARADLAKVFKFYVGALTKDYQGHVTAGDFSKSREEQSVDGAMKVVTSATLSGVMIIDHYEFPERGEFFSLAKLDLNRFSEYLSRYKSLSKEVVNSVRSRAKMLHEEMSREIDKLSNRKSSGIEEEDFTATDDVASIDIPEDVVHPEDEDDLF